MGRRQGAHTSLDRGALGAHFVDREEARAFGDVVQRVTRLSPCPVVVVPTAEDGG